MLITCGEINGDKFGGVEYNDDLYVLNNPLEEWRRRRGKELLGRVDSTTPQTE